MNGENAQSEAFTLQLLGYSPSNMNYYAIVQLCLKFGAFITFWTILLHLGYFFIIICRKKGWASSPPLPHYGSIPVLIQ